MLLEVIEALKNIVEGISPVRLWDLQQPCRIQARADGSCSLRDLLAEFASHNCGWRPDSTDVPYLLSFALFVVLGVTRRDAVDGLPTTGPRCD